MAEDFPHSHHEDSDDDDAPVSQNVNYVPAPAYRPEQHTAPPGQEGTIFSRGNIASTISRPLFEFIRKQEQPAAQNETSELLRLEVLPSVSVPDEPEVRTYQPPVNAQAAEAAHRAAEEHDDDDDDDEDDEPTDDTQAQPAVPVAPVQPPELQRPLNEQFEAIMRNEMGNDTTHATPGDRVGEQESDDDEPPVVFTPVPPVPRTPPTPEPPVRRHPEPPREFEWPVPVMPEAASPAVEDASETDLDDEIEVAAEDAAEVTDETVPATAGTAEAFYYAEDDADATSPVVASTGTGSSGSPMFGYTPPTGTGGGGSGSGSGGSGSASGGGVVPPATPPPTSSASFSSAPPPYGSTGFGSAPMASGSGGFFNTLLAPNLVANGIPVRNERRENHNGRWFVAGVITGWLLKQHFANKKLRLVQKEAKRTAEKQQEQVDTLQYNQYHAAQKLKRTEGELQQTQAAQAKQAARSAETTRTTQQQLQRAELAKAEAERSMPLQSQSGAGQVRTAPGAPGVMERAPSAEQHTTVPLAAAVHEQTIWQTPSATLTEQQRPLVSPVPEQSASNALPFAEQPRGVAQVSSEQTPNSFVNTETPLQYAAEIPFVAAAAAASYSRRGEAPVAAAVIGGEAVSTPSGELPVQAPQDAELVVDAYSLQRGEHIEHATGGGHDIVVDRHGREVQGAKVYGDEFHAQRRREQVSASAFGGRASGNGGGDNGGSPASGMYNSNIIAGLASGQTDNQHQLPTGPQSPSVRQHLLRGKNQSNNPIVATIASPWLWASLIVLIAAFIIAAFI